MTAGGAPVAVHTLDEAAAILRVKPSWLERQAAARRIPFTMLGGSYRFTAEHLAAIVRQYEQQPVMASADDVARSCAARRGNPAAERYQESSHCGPARGVPPNPWEKTCRTRKSAGISGGHAGVAPAESWNPSPDSGRARLRRIMAATRKQRYATIRILIRERGSSALRTGLIGGIRRSTWSLRLLSNYRYQIEVNILPEFGHRPLDSLTPEEIAAWEMRLTNEGGYAHRTARDARSTLATILNDAVPRYIQSNPAERKRGKGRKGLRRIAKRERAEKVWPTPLQALLIAERCAALSGQDTDFVMNIYVAYTGSRWSEVIGLLPECVHDDQVAIDWKLYELNGRFYRGRPKDGSMRPADLPPFLAQLLAGHLATAGSLKCTCRNTEQPWCPGAEYVFLGPGRGHFRRSNYSERFFRPAADGWYLPRNGKSPRPAVPVLVTECDSFPGRPVPPWPAATPGEDFMPPTGRGLPRLVSDEHTARCAVCGRAWPRRMQTER